MTMLIDFFSDKPLVFYFGLLLLILVGIQIFTAVKRTKKTAKIHRISGYLMVIVVIIHAFLGFSLYL